MRWRGGGGRVWGWESCSVLVATDTRLVTATRLCGSFAGGGVGDLDWK